MEEGFKYNFSGNNIGHLSYGGGNADGVWSSWKIESIQMEFRYYRDGAHLRFIGKTDRGSLTWKGVLDEETKNMLEPFDFDIDFFIPVNEFCVFLVPEKSMIDPEKRPSMLIDQLKESTSLYYRKGNS